LTDWLYDRPIWLVGSLIVGACVVVSSLGLVAVDRLVDIELRRSHNDIAGFLIAIVGILYAVLLAFIAVVTWETYAKAGDIVDSEANTIGNMYDDAVGVLDSVGPGYRRLLIEYVQLVIDEEWPAQRAGRTDKSAYANGWTKVRELTDAIARFEPKTQGQSNMHTELLQDLDRLLSARRTRQLAAESHIPALIWWVIFFGGVLTIAFTYLFGPRSHKMHMTMTAGVAASLALVILLIMAFDSPFRGDVGIASDAYQTVLHDRMSSSRPNP